MVKNSEYYKKKFDRLVFWYSLGPVSISGKRKKEKNVGFCFQENITIQYHVFVTVCVSQWV